MLLVGIAGGTGSGRTTFANKILHRLNDSSHSAHAVILHQDSYYLPTPPKELIRPERANYDHPAAFDWDLLRLDLAKLKEGQKVATPTYDFKTSRRQTETIAVGPCRAILMEGIYALWDEEIRDLMDLRVYLDVDADIRFIRRLHRDVKERGRSLDGIIRQYYDTVRPMHHQFLAPTQQYADIIVGEENDRAADLIAAKIRHAIEST